MFSFEGAPILVYSDPVDMRRSIDGLSILVSNHFGADPHNGSLYVFCNRHRDKMKILYWSCNGFCLWYKRLERERFKMPRSAQGVLTMSFQQLRWLLDGLDYTKLQGHKSVSCSTYFKGKKDAKILRKVKHSLVFSGILWV